MYAVVFSIDDVEQTGEKAEKMGIRVLKKVKLGQDDVKWSFQDRYNPFIEYFLNAEDTHGASIVLGQF